MFFSAYAIQQNYKNPITYNKLQHQKITLIKKILFYNSVFNYVIPNSILD